MAKNKLTESADLDQARIILSIKDVESRLQKIIEQVARIGVDDVMATSTAMRSSYGPDMAGEFDTASAEAIQTAVNGLKAAKDHFTNTVAKLEGKLDGTDNDMTTFKSEMDDDGLNDDAGDDAVDGDDSLLGDADAEDTETGDQEEEQETPALDQEPSADVNGEPTLGRAKRESVIPRKPILESATDTAVIPASIVRRVENSFAETIHTINHVPNANVPNMLVLAIIAIMDVLSSNKIKVTGKFREQLGDIHEQLRKIVSWGKKYETNPSSTPPTEAKQAILAFRKLRDTWADYLDEIESVTEDAVYTPIVIAGRNLREVSAVCEALDDLDDVVAVERDGDTTLYVSDSAGTGEYRAEKLVYETFGFGVTTDLRPAIPTKRMLWETIYDQHTHLTPIIINADRPFADLEALVDKAVIAYDTKRVGKNLIVFIKSESPSIRSLMKMLRDQSIQYSIDPETLETLDVATYKPPVTEGEIVSINLTESVISACVNEYVKRTVSSPENRRVLTEGIQSSMQSKPDVMVEFVIDKLFEAAEELDAVTVQYFDFNGKSYRASVDRNDGMVTSVWDISARRPAPEMIDRASEIISNVNDNEEENNG